MVRSRLAPVGQDVDKLDTADVKMDASIITVIKIAATGQRNVANCWSTDAPSISAAS